MLGPDITWYLAVSAMLFAIGALGVLLRRSPLIVLLSLEIMLNGGNLALIAFSRLHGESDGQVFAIAVMAVAASEVVVGLGLIVAMSRRNLALGVGNFHVGLEILVDPLSVFMMLVVSGVGSLIVAYSLGYMDGDDEERRFFAYMSLFVFSMLLL